MLKPGLFAPADETHGAPGQPADKGAPPAIPADFQKQLDDLKKQNATLEQESRTWHGRYQELDHKLKTSAPGARGGDPDEDDEEVEPTEADVKVAEGELIDQLSKGDVSTLAKKLNGLTKKEAAALIQKEARKIAREEVGAARAELSQRDQLKRDFPDIDNSKSELFKEADAILKEKIAAGTPKELLAQPHQFRMLIELAKARVDARTPDRGASRAAAIAAQQGATGGGGGRDMDEDDQVIELNAEQKKMLADMNRDGQFVVTEEAFKKRAKKGVNIGGATATAMAHIQGRR